MTAFYSHMIYYINIYIIFCYIACFVPCVVCWCYVVCTASATSTQASKARRVYGSYTQAVDEAVDKFGFGDFVVDKFCEGVDKTKHALHALPRKTHCN